MKLNGTHVRFDTCRNLFKQPKQRAKLFSENCNLQNFSGFDVTAILFHDFFFF